MKKKKEKLNWDLIFFTIWWCGAFVFLTTLMGVGGYFLSFYSNGLSILAIIAAGYSGGVGGIIWYILLKGFFVKSKEVNK